MRADLVPHLGWICGLVAMAAAGRAEAQLSGSITLASDYRLRGISLTERRAALSLSAAYDDKSGVYAGGSVIAHNPEDGGARILGHTEYVGYAARLGDSGASWDVGAANVQMDVYVGGRKLDYRQVYVGLSKDALSARLSFSPDYPRPGVDSTYLDLNGAVRAGEDWRVSGHVGVMSRLGGSRAMDGKPDRMDVRVGLTRAFPRGELQLAWNAVTPRPRPLYRRTHSGVSVSASVFF